MPSEWYYVTAAESVIFALIGFGLSVADGWPVVPTAALGVQGGCVALLVPGLLLPISFTSRAASGMSMALVLAVSVAVAVDWLRDDRNVTLFLFGSSWASTAWQASARVRALAIVLPSLVFSSACIRAANTEAHRELTAQRRASGTISRTATVVGVAQLFTATIQLLITENESRFGGLEHDILNSYDAIRDWSLLILLFLLVADMAIMLVLFVIPGVAGKIIATLLSAARLAFWMLAAFLLWPQDYVWVNFALAMLHLCAAIWDAWHYFLEHLPEAQTASDTVAASESTEGMQKRTAIAYQQRGNFVYDPMNSVTMPSSKSAFGRLPPLYKDQLENGIQQAPRLLKQPRQARIQKIEKDKDE